MNSPQPHRDVTDRLQFRGISKAYAAVIANDNVALRVAPGEIHAVVGENGAGKSTLMKIIYGIVRPDRGEMLWNGREVVIASPAEAQRLGIGMVFQHFALFDTLTVAENIALAMATQGSRAELSDRISSVAAKYRLPVDPSRHIYTMSVGARQRVEIIRALLQKPGLLILDEPTSVLTPQAVEKLFETLRVVASEGCSILYISHKLNEIQSLCDSSTVLRGGRVTGTCIPRQETEASIARLMIGEDLPRYRTVAQPTWGVDVGAAVVIGQALLDLRDKGAAILVISEELDELFEIADRIAVISNGRLSPGVPRDKTNRDQIGLAMTGSRDGALTPANGGRHAAAL